MIFKFKLLAGTFVENGKTLEPGAIISSVRRLDKVFGEESMQLMDKEFEDADIPRRERIPMFKLKHLGGGWYDILNTSLGTKINDTKLRKTAANEKLAELNA